MKRQQTIRIAAAGDIHCSPENRDRVVGAFAALEDTVDLILLAGDLTTHGEPEQAVVLADACRGLTLPIFAVLGNHDWHSGRQDEVVDVITSAGVRVLERSWATYEIRGASVGVVGTKGFVGGFPDSELPDFGEPLLRQVYAETTAEVEALELGLEAVSHCGLRIVLLHYAPTTTTLVGEPPVIWAFLGSDRLGRPIRDHRPDLVLNGHAHAGTFAGSIEDVPVYNVAVPVMERDFWVFELEGGVDAPGDQPDIHVETEAAEPPGEHRGPH
ncbi:MAG: metallophosphoesterase [Actinobacteria bacterium]|nr:metallophosphoesterase [Actinomycetota bacterium]